MVAKDKKYLYEKKNFCNLGGLDILHGKTCYNRLICIYL